MKVKMILPALTEANSPFFRPIKYSLFPPHGLATLMGLDNSGQAGHVAPANARSGPDGIWLSSFGIRLES
jgi:hypothetical protein